MTDHQRTPDARTAEQRMEEIRARLAVATRGPLYLFPVEADEAWPCIKDAHWDVCRQEVDLVDVESSHGVTTGRLEGTMINVGCYLGEKADAELFTNAARDITWLLSRLTTLEAQVARLTEELKEANDDLSEWEAREVACCEGPFEETIKSLSRQLDNVISELASERSARERAEQERDAWENFAEHVAHCVECGQTSYENCWEGSQFRAAIDAARTQEG